MAKQIDGSPLASKTWRVYLYTTTFLWVAAATKISEMAGHSQGHKPRGTDPRYPPTRQVDVDENLAVHGLNSGASRCQ